MMRRVLVLCVCLLAACGSDDSGSGSKPISGGTPDTAAGSGGASGATAGVPIGGSNSVGMPAVAGSAGQGTMPPPRGFAGRGMDTAGQPSGAGQTAQGGTGQPVAGGDGAPAGSLTPILAPEPKPSAGCGMPAPMSGMATIDVMGTSRSYIMTLPQNYDPAKPYKLIFAWHGLGGTAQQIASNWYGLSRMSQSSAIFVAGQGLRLRTASAAVLAGPTRTVKTSTS